MREKQTQRAERQEGNSGFKKWLRQTSVVLVSASSVRLERLRAMGFRKVTVAPLAEENEDQALGEITGGKQEIAYNLRAAPTAQNLAEAKIEEALREGSIGIRDLAVAIDTMPVCFVSKPDLGDLGVSETCLEVQLTKPEKNKEAETIISVLRAIYDGYQDFLKVSAEVRDDATFRQGFKQKNLRIYTDIAVRMPNERFEKQEFTYLKSIKIQPGKSIRSVQIELNLALQRVYDLAPEKFEEKLAKLANEVIDAMKAANTDPVQVTGGIDFGNPKVREILGVQVLGDHNSDKPEDIYAGFPQVIFQKFLQAIWAEDKKSGLKE